MTYLALLRGINVGGNRKVEMARLSQTFERLGLTHVRTFINSGNVIFVTNDADVTEITSIIEAAIEKDFGFEVKVLLKSLPQIKELIDALPDNWVNDKNMKCDVMFLWNGVDSPEILKQIPHNPDIEDVRYFPGAVVWRIDRNKVKPGQHLKINGPNVSSQLTVRNPNTVRKIYELMLVAGPA